MLGLQRLQQRPTVLIVDDIPSNIELIEVIIKAEGYSVLKAYHGNKAVELFEELNPDIAIIDVMMPDMDGYQLCHILKDLAGKRYFPIIMLTALNDKESKIKGLECGADDFISKPFEPRELLVKMRSLLKLKELHDELEHSENIILTLAVALEARDPYTRGHSTRVGELSYEFASFLGLCSRDQEMLKKAGILHDIGKIGMSETILKKPAPLTDDEFNLIKRHPIIGEQICSPLHSLQDILPAIRHHHERWDGRGFPDGLNGRDIPFYARILSIVDSFDAMLSERPYRQGRTYYDVLAAMRREQYSGQWDPELVSYFIEMASVINEEIFSMDSPRNIYQE
ncbi:MAG TPA: response regulator [Nitrospirae bacterium]|nr:response regulator [Nitrospirota bacterium]